MTKILITPDVVNDYISLKEIPIATIYSTGITFNKSAKVNLALKKDCCFTLMYEDGRLYYSDSTSGFKLQESGRGKIVTAQAKGILHFGSQLCLVADYEATQYQFSIKFNTSKNE